MNSTANRGWTWGVNGQTPIAALRNDGRFQIANNFTAVGNIYGNRFYDRNNTGYFLDPASTSIVNDLRASRFYDRNNTGYYLDPASTSNLNIIKTKGLEVHTSSSGSAESYLLKVTAYCNDCQGETWYPFYISGSSQNARFGVVGGEPSFDGDPYNFKTSKLIAKGSIASYQRGNGNTAQYVRISGGSTREIITDSQASALWVKKDNNFLQNIAVEKVFAREVEVTSGNYVFPDYVFDEDYDLRSIEELASYIKENHHLPEIPSAEEVEENGMQLGEMSVNLLKKIEELTLYMIQLNKENEALKNRVKVLEDEG